MKRICLILTLVMLVLFPLQYASAEKNYSLDFRTATHVGAFSEEGLAWFQARSGLYGYVNTEGKVVIPPRFRTAKDFSDGLALVSWDLSSYGYIDTTGNQVFQAAGGSRAKSFSEGLAAVYDEETSCYGYVGTDGSFAIAPQFSYDASSFVNGYASTDSGVIDKTGQVVLEGQRGTVTSAGLLLNDNGASSLPGAEIPSIIREFTSGSYSNTVSLKTEDGHEFFAVNVESSSDCKLQNAWKTDEGTLLLIYSKPKWTGIESYALYNIEQGRFVIYGADSIGSFSEGLIPVTMEGLTSFHDAEGDVAFLAGASASAFSDGYALVKMLDQYYFLDHSGNPVYGPFTAANPFSNGYAAVYDQSGWWSVLKAD